MASMQFGPVSAARVRRWLRDGHFDVVHVHEPAPPSVSLLVCMIAKGPIVATFHAATTRSKWLAAWGPVRAALAGADQRPDRGLGLRPPGAGRAPRRGRGDHPQRRARRRRSPRVRRCPGITRGVDGPTIGFLGRFDEPRKGLPVLLEAMRTVVGRHPGARLLIAGRGDADAVRELIGDDLRAVGEPARRADARRTRRHSSGRSTSTARPNLLGESFGVVLIEALAAGAPIVASDLDAFARVLEDGAAGVLVRRGDAGGAGRGAVRAAGRPRPARASSPPAGPGWRPATTGTSWPGGSSPSTRPCCRPTGGEVTAGEDDDDLFPAVPPARSQARSVRRRRAQH